MKKRWTVAAYTEDQVYGGPEEGGWWYDQGVRLDKGHDWPLSERSERPRTFTTEVKALRYKRRLTKYINSVLDELDLPSYHSVLSKGRVVVRVFNGSAPEFYPEYRPHYE